LLWGVAFCETICKNPSVSLENRGSLISIKMIE
jgi:hypothetical protein